MSIGYVLLLSEDKYYIGISEHLDVRLSQHFCGEGASWTKRYPPIQLLETFEGGKVNEKQKTMDFMERYGWQNVRGAGWTGFEIKQPLFLRNGAPANP